MENLCFNHLSGKITGLDKMRLLRAQILWEMLYHKNVDFVALLWEDFVFQRENIDSKKQEKIFVSIADDYQVYGALFPEVMTNQKMRASLAYKTYLLLATRAVTPKKARKFKKLASPLKKKTLVIVEDHEPAKKVQRNDLLSEAALLEEAQVKKVLKRSRRETTIHQAGGSGDGAGFQPDVPDEPKGKSGDSGDEDAEYQQDDEEDALESDDDLHQADDERTDSENQKTNNEDEESDNEFVITSNI
ncbi:hypothetical protein Tco_1232747 [Tanacetum coccineum]